jgi:hypothetical protein
MGYVHDTAMSQFIPPTACCYSAGTWTWTVGTNVWTNVRTANDSSFTVYVPIALPSNSVAFKGSKLLSLEFMYVISGAAADDFAVATALLYLDTFAVTGTINTAATIASTKDTGHDTDAECLAQDEHRMVLTVDDPLWIDNDQGYHAEFVVDGGAATVFANHGAIANFVLRI